MPSKHSRDGENVSLDEMMRRLKAGSEEDNRPEIVTREDGTQVVRKRSRKRRSSQPLKEERKRKQKALLIQLAIVFGLIAIGIAAFAFYMVRYNRSAYARQLEKQIGAVTGVNTDLGRLTATPFGISIDNATLTGDQSDVLKELQLSKLTVKRSLPSFFIGNMEGEGVSASRGEAFFQLPLQPDLTADVLADNNFSFLHYECSQFNTIFGDRRNPNAKVADTRLLLYEKSGNLELRLNGGKLNLRDFGTYPVKTGTIEIGKQGLRIVGLNLATESGQGEISLSQQLTSKVLESAGIQAAVTNVDTRYLLSNGLGEILTGQLSAESGMIEMSPQADQPLLMSLPFSSGEIALNRLPMVKGLKDLVRIDVEKLIFSSTVRGIIERQGASTILKDLHIEAAGKMLVKGRLAVDANGSLSGKLRIGVAKTKVLGQGGELDVYGFSEVRDGMCWVDVSVGGSVSSPSDTLANTLRAAKENGGIDAAGGFEGVFDQLKVK